MWQLFSDEWWKGIGLLYGRRTTCVTFGWFKHWMWFTLHYLGYWVYDCLLVKLLLTLLSYLCEFKGCTDISFPSTTWWDWFFNGLNGNSWKEIILYLHKANFISMEHLFNCVCSVVKVESVPSILLGFMNAYCFIF